MNLKIFSKESIIHVLILHYLVGGAGLQLLEYIYGKISKIQCEMKLYLNTNSKIINIYIVCSLYLYKRLKIIPAQFQDILRISFCYIVFYENRNDKNILFKKKGKNNF